MNKRLLTNSRVFLFVALFYGGCYLADDWLVESQRRSLPPIPPPKMRPLYRIAEARNVSFNFAGLTEDGKLALSVVRPAAADTRITAWHPSGGAVVQRTAGQWTTPAGVRLDKRQAALYRAGRAIAIGTLGGDDSEGNDVNARGEVVGVADTGQKVPLMVGVGADRRPSEQMPSVRRAFLWSGGKMLDLGTLEGGENSEANGINDRGQIVGYCVRPGQGAFAFLWEAGRMRELGFPEAKAINNRGQIVGTTHESRGRRSAVLWENGRTRYLGLPVGYPEKHLRGGRPIAINEHGIIVGDVGLIPPTDRRHRSRRSVPTGFVWKRGTMYLLQSVLADDAGYTIDKAVAINERGDILVRGHGSEDYPGTIALVLSPILAPPKPSRPAPAR